MNNEEHIIKIYDEIDLLREKRLSYWLGVFVGAAMTFLTLLLAGLYL